MFFRRSQDHFTSLASTGEPSENLAAGSRWKVNSVWSALLSHFVGEQRDDRLVVLVEIDQPLIDGAQIDLAGVAEGARRIERIEVHVARDHDRVGALREGRRDAAIPASIVDAASPADRLRNPR